MSGVVCVVIEPVVVKTAMRFMKAEELLVFVTFTLVADVGITVATYGAGGIMCLKSEV